MHPVEPRQENARCLYLTLQSDPSILLATLVMDQQHRPSAAFWKQTFEELFVEKSNRFLAYLKGWMLAYAKHWGQIIQLDLRLRYKRHTPLSYSGFNATEKIWSKLQINCLSFLSKIQKWNGVGSIVLESSNCLAYSWSRRENRRDCSSSTQWTGGLIDFFAVLLQLRNLIERVRVKSACHWKLLNHQKTTYHKTGHLLVRVKRFSRRGSTMCINVWKS